MRPNRLPLLLLRLLPDLAAAILLQTPHPALAVYGAVQVRGADEAAGDAGFYAAPGRTLGLVLESNGTTTTTTTATTATKVVPDVYGKLTLRRAGPRHQLSVMALNLQPAPDETNATGGFAIDADGRFVHRAQNPRGLWDACGRPGDYRLAVAADDGLGDCVRNISLIALG